MNQLRFNCIRAAMEAGLQSEYDKEGKLIGSVDRLLDAAKKIEEYLKEENVK